MPAIAGTLEINGKIKWCQKKSQITLISCPRKRKEEEIWDRCSVPAPLFETCKTSNCAFLKCPRNSQSQQEHSNVATTAVHVQTYIQHLRFTSSVNPSVQVIVNKVSPVCVQALSEGGSMETREGPSPWAMCHRSPGWAAPEPVWWDWGWARGLRRLDHESSTGSVDARPAQPAEGCPAPGSVPRPQNSPPTSQTLVWRHKKTGKA